MSRLMTMLTQRSDSDAVTTPTTAAEPDSPGNTEPDDVAVKPGHGLVVWSLQVWIAWLSIDFRAWLFALI